MTKTIRLTVLRDNDTTELSIPRGSNLRRTLIDAGLTPYAKLMQQANCRGRGLCATCGVKVLSGEPAPTHWHDKAAKAFRYPRLSCQITLNEAMTVRILTDKKVWGARLPKEIDDAS